jgi:[NiFe] hydrogenase assembly HybE family chaperone
MTDAAVDLAARIRAAYERIRRERMAGLPFVNEALQVEVIGLRPWHGLWLGVLVTPWCMNLLLLPGDAASLDGEPPGSWPRLVAGQSAQFGFPAGVMSFFGGREAEFGEYLACSLFSPMFEFADHGGATATAEACLLALLQPQVAAAQAAPAAPAAPADAGKRDFLRGRWHEERPPLSGG